MKLYIKNMVCNRCKAIVENELKSIGIQWYSIDFGLVNTKKDITPLQRRELGAALHESGIELVSENRNELIEKLKTAISDLEHISDEDLKTDLPDYISKNVDDNFISLNILFTEIEGISIEKYIVRHKIERIKELLVYDGFDIPEIAKKLHYSSLAQMSSQFKQITGLTPLHFKNLRQKKRPAKLSNQPIITINPTP